MKKLFLILIILMMIACNNRPCERPLILAPETSKVDTVTYENRKR